MTPVTGLDSLTLTQPFLSDVKLQMEKWRDFKTVGIWNELQGNPQISPIFLKITTPVSEKPKQREKSLASAELNRAEQSHFASV